MRFTPGATGAMERRAGFAPAAITGATCPIDAGSGPHADRHGRTDGHSQPAEWSSRGGRQHLDSVSGLRGDSDGRSAGPADARGSTGRHCDLYICRIIRRARTLITAERKATCRSRWACMARSLSFPPAFLLPARTGLPLTNPGGNAAAKAFWGETDFRLAPAAYDHAKSCYDREYLFQWAEMDPRIHNAALAQVTALSTCTAGAPGCSSRSPDRAVPSGLLPD